MGLNQIIAIRQRLEKVDQFIRKTALPQVLKELKPIIEDLNIAQLQKGQRPDGTYLPDYSPRSVSVFGKTPGPMTMHETGAFYRGMNLIVENSEMKMTDTDPKTEMLEENYGPLRGISKASLKTLKNDYLVEELGIKTKNYVKFGY